ncbi:MAG: OmpA family protein [Thioalkalivibrio sp.]
MQATASRSAHNGYRYNMLHLASLAAALLLVACASPTRTIAQTVQPPDIMTQAGQAEMQTNQTRRQPDEGQEKPVDFALFQISDNLLFDSQSWELDADTRRDLDTLASSLAGFPQHSVIIVGHSDDAEDASLELSQRRADTVRSYLVRQGISPDRLYTAASESPQIDNSTASGNQQNRRVEILVSESRMTIR